MILFLLALAATVADKPVEAQSPTVEALFVRASVDNERPYLGQQITYTFAIYQHSRANMSSVKVRYRAPGFTGFWNSQETEREGYNEIIDSNEYWVANLKTALFPSVAGPVSILPGILDITSTNSTARSQLESLVVDVQVQTLPDGAPVGFTGAVGRFEISASTDLKEVTMNNPVRLTVDVAGEGNLEALPDPAWPELVGWRVIESPVNIESRVVAGLVTGARTYQILLVPEASGELTIPQIRFPHFDPFSGQYVQTSTEPIVVTVSGAEDTGTVPQLPSLEPSGEEIQEMHPLKAVPNSLRWGGSELVGSVPYWTAWSIPALAIVGAVAWKRRRASKEAARADALQRNALPGARAALERAVAAGNDPRVAASEVLLSYISARLDIQVVGITREALLRWLRQAGAPPALEERVKDVLVNGESARYAPMNIKSGETGDYTNEVLQLLDEIEGAIGI